MKALVLVLSLLVASLALAQVGAPADQPSSKPATTAPTTKNEGLAMEKDGVVFEMVLPEREWSIPENKPGASSLVKLGLQITNKTDKPLRFNSYDTLSPDLLTPDGKETHRWDGPLATYRHRQPQEADFPLVMPGKTVTISVRTELFWPTIEDRTLMLRSSHSSGSPGPYFDKLKPGPYRIRLVYENQIKTAVAEYPARKALEGTVWTGRIATPSVQVSIREQGKDGPSTAARPRVAKAQAQKLAKAAAEKDLNTRAGSIRIELDDKPTIADNQGAWTFTWQGVSKAGGYIVTVRVDNSGEVRVLQSKIGSNRD